MFVFAVCVVFICADLVVSSANIGTQNANSSTTQDETTRGGMMTSNSNSGSTNTSTTRRRRRRRAQATTPAATDATATEAATTQETSTGSGSTRETSADPAVQADLSGTYTGTVNYPEGGLNGPATLTITGSTFTLTPDGGGAAVSGSVNAVTTRGYTGVTMMFGDRTPPPVTQSPPPLPAVSLRAKTAGGKVTLMSVPGEKREFSFSSTVAQVRRARKKRGGIKPPTATATPEATPEATP
jgi:hypothetical protein